MSNSVDQLPEIHQKLCIWFEDQQRSLPWRETYDPYQVWISEIMAQQTRMDTVIGYFHRWMEKYPTIQDLAKAEEEELLKLWEGLGYYSRARNILKTAKVLQQDFGNQLPQDRKALESLPGIGSYTAGAIASIAYQQEEPIIDGNVQRVFSRLFDWKEDVAKSVSKKFFTQKGQELLLNGKARCFNQALMELGALICQPQNPSCTDCPLEVHCHAKAKDTIALRPVKAKRPSTIKKNVILFVIQSGNKYYLEKQAKGALWANMWSFPYFDFKQQGSSLEVAAEDLLREKFQLRKNFRFLSPFAHSVTRYRIQAYPLLVDSFEATEENWSKDFSGQWFSLQELEELSLPKSGVMIRQQLQDH